MCTHFIIFDESPQKAGALQESLNQVVRGAETTIHLLGKDSPRIPHPVGNATKTVIFVPAKHYDAHHLAPYLAVRPDIVFTVDAMEKNCDELYLLFRYCIRAPYNLQKLRFLLLEMEKTTPAAAEVWQFLLLRIDWRYARIPFQDIRQIQRKGSFTKIDTWDNRAFITYLAVGELESRLPGDAFIRIQPGLILPRKRVGLERNALFIDGLPWPIRGRFVREAIARMNCAL